MPFSEKDICVAKAVVSWLNAVAARSDAEAADSLFAASQCVQSAFGIDDSACDIDLECAVCGVKEEKSTAVCACGDDKQFMDFVKILRDKGFFAGVEEGSDEYNKRMALAKENFDKMRAVKNAPPPSTEEAKKPEQSEKQVPIFVTKEDEVRAEELKCQGNDALKAGEVERASELYAEASKLNPNNAIYHCNRAAALMKLDRDDEAITECESAIKLNPQFPRSYSRLGAALHKLGRYQEALDRGYNKALELEPSNETVQDNIRACKHDMEVHQSASSSNAGNAGGMPDFSQLAKMMQDPAMQEKAKKVAQDLGLGGGEGGNGDFDPSKMMGNPMIQQMMNNPMIQQMAQNIASNPEMMNNLASMFSSMMGGNGANPPQ